MPRPFTLSRHFSTATKLETPLSSLQPPKFSRESTAISEEFCGQILDKYPDIRTLKGLHAKIIFDQGLRSNPSIGIKLMRAYAACGHPEITRHVFDEFPDRGVIFFNVMIRSYVNNQFYQDALVEYRTMSKCGCLVEARRVLDEMPHKDAVSWNSMVAVYAQNGRFDDALGVCREMELFNIKADAGTMASLLPAVTNTSAKNISFVEELFMKLAKESVISWNVMVAVYMKNSMPALAVELYLEMESRGMEPDAITFASVLPACGDLSALSLGRHIDECVERKRLRPNLSLENGLIDMYAKCGCLDDAREVFDGMQYRDVASWTSIISAYGKSGQGCDAVALFSKMQDSGVTPDSIAFVSIISACSHAGLLNEGKYFYKLMTKKYRMVPRLEHFACMVDLLGRAGKLDEAYDFIKQMPLEPNERVWGALLSACRIYSKMDIGIIAADHLFQLVPEQAGYYVLLSNIYAKAGRWEEVSAIRSIMKGRGIKKTPGFSNVELDHKVHTFLAGDQSHPQSKEIYEELDVMVGKMKEAGYAPETDSALHDLEEEDKQYHLTVHSEKLAIVFALINTKPGTPIRITKNLRVCGDCHIAVKLISKIAERKIIVRDTHRFHHFQNGVCSCGDYW
ncbi:putative pentatricopeptide repeat-containing protein At3g49142 isoform X2 [Diospyros lotus]|uniref:putative pentatricopeptide repeat-containing protein At3g49142 isoform X2 n=1 Tax=Diospyros lotus TaxID=55363 RepID=UPI00224F42F2|nr:putative pentatricopeptide repeat-containing protein At3g49142 isoform X2 [Diospyros lotus]